jgi:hypothetical protein
MKMGVIMEKPKPELLSTDLFDDDGGKLYYKASEMDGYIDALKASLADMIKYVEWLKEVKVWVILEYNDEGVYIIHDVYATHELALKEMATIEPSAGAYISAFEVEQP